MTVGGCGQGVAAWAEDVGDLVMCSEKSLRLSGRLEPAHDLLASPRRSVTAFDPVVEALVGAVIGVRGLMGNRLDVAAQFIRNYDPWLAKLRDQPGHKALRSFGIPARLDENIERVAIAINRTPEPVFHTVDGDHGHCQVVFPA